MTQPTTDPLRNLADRAEHHGGLTGQEATRLRDGIDQLHALADQAEAALNAVRTELDRISELPTVTTCDTCNSFSTGVRWTIRMIRENTLDTHTTKDQT